MTKHRPGLNRLAAASKLSFGSAVMLGLSGGFNDRAGNVTRHSGSGFQMDKRAVAGDVQAALGTARRLMSKK